MDRAVLRERGQVSIEFLLIIIISLIYIYSVARPLLVDTGIAAAEDVKRMSDAKIAAQKLANAVNEAAAGSESKRTINLFLPAGTAIACDLGEISYTAEISNLYCRNPAPADCTYPGECTDGVGNFDCTGSIAVLGSADCPAMSGPLYKAVEVEKGSGGQITVAWKG